MRLTYGSIKMDFRSRPCKEVLEDLEISTLYADGVVRGKGHLTLDGMYFINIL